MTLTGDDAVKQSDLSEYSIIRVPAEDRQLGQTIPPRNPHGVSISIPSWGYTLAWARRESWIVKILSQGYPRFVLHPLVNQLADLIIDKFSSDALQRSASKAMVFCSRVSAERCALYLKENDPNAIIQVVHLNTRSASFRNKYPEDELSMSAIMYPEEDFIYAKQFWQHTGEGVSSRRAECYIQNFDAYELADELHPDMQYSPIVHSNSTKKICGVVQDSKSADAKRLIRERIASWISQDLALGSPRVGTNDVFLFSIGMQALAGVYRAILLTERAKDTTRTIAFGFCYVDTYKLLSRFGSKDSILYGQGTTKQLDELESKLEGGEQILALFCEIPNNPLLQTCDLPRIRRLADRYNFIVVVDETVATFINVDVLPFADIVFDSLTKLFSGKGDVAGGSVIINPLSRHYQNILKSMKSVYVDHYFSSDAVTMEKNSRDFPIRVKAINSRAKELVVLLKNHPVVKQVYHPLVGETKPLYEQCKRSTGGYGYLLSIDFTSAPIARRFYDCLDISRGPSLGTNFSLACPFSLFAHFKELDWVAQFGVDEHLVRLSVGLESKEELINIVVFALSEASKVVGNNCNVS